MKALSVIAGASLILIIGSCKLGSNSSDHDAMLGFNSGFALPGFDFTTMVIGFGGEIYFLTSESGQGGADLNGDGDAADNVMTRVDPDTNTGTNLNVSARRPLASTAARVVWSVSEADEGLIDFSGDGDVADQVLASYDPALPVGPGNPLVTSVNVSAFSPLLTFGDLVVFVTSEQDLGVNLNGDGDTDDFVVRVFNANTGAVVLNTALAWDFVTGSLSVANGIAAWHVSETDQGATDLNGDGDSSDSVVFGADLTALTTFPVGPGGSPRASSTFLPQIMGSAAAPVIGYAIDESQEGAVSLNSVTFPGDTDSSDFVLALFDVNTGTETLPYSGIAVDPFQIVGNDTRVVFVALETSNTGTTNADFNSDGDDADDVPFWIDLATPATATSLGLASKLGDAAVRLCDQFAVWSASESDQGPLGTNHNATSGDPDFGDDVAFYSDLSAPGIPSINTGMATNDQICFSGRFFILTPEAGQNGLDVNQDGDANDIVPVYWVIAGATIFRGVSPIITDGPITFQICPNIIRIFANVSENNGFGDLNHDFDEEDFIMHSTRIFSANGKFDVATIINTCDLDQSSFAVNIDADTVAYPLAEQNIGIGLDKNADGDFSDLVLHFVNTNCP